MLRLSVVALAVASTITAGVTAGCGNSSGADHTSATPAEAVTEIGQVKALLATAVAQVRAGNADAAEQTVGDAYLEHFESVEGSLGERDHDLMEELEEAISSDLRQDIKDGKSAVEIKGKVDEIDADLDRAVELLQR